jgi:hypothetical protein
MAITPGKEWKFLALLRRLVLGKEVTYLAAEPDAEEEPAKACYVDHWRSLGNEAWEESNLPVPGRPAAAR